MRPRLHASMPAWHFLARAAALIGILLGIGMPQLNAAERRDAWTTSRVTGSAEPPSPYLSERAFPQFRFAEPIEFVPFPNGRHVVIAELKGKLFLVDPTEPGQQPVLWADFKAIHPDVSNFYGLAFHPGFATNRWVYVCYVQKDSDPAGSKVSRFRAAARPEAGLEAESEEILLTFLGGGHNGGSLHFGNDGMLYVSTGDGRGPDPPDDLNTGQDLGDLLSSILRIDVDRRDAGRTYAIPKDNPFVGRPGIRGEIWAYGFRNPWRMSFDRTTGDLWVGDVGWELWEMVYRVQKGGNYGWSVMEGKQLIKPGGKLGPTPLLPPTAIHPHSEAASITGGYVYRGEWLPRLKGSYVYGDWETGKIWSLRHDQGAVKSLIEMVDTTNKVVAFGEDHQRELYYLDSSAGTVHRLVENPKSGQPSHYPRRLSETGIFDDTRRLVPAPGVHAFTPATPLWRDGAESSRVVALPGRTQLVWTNNAWVIPRDSVWTKTYSMEVLEPDGTPNRRRIETQLLHFTGESWNAYTYAWNDAQSDAELVGRGGAEKTLRIRDSSVRGGTSELVWRFHSQAECLRCHNPWTGTLLGFSPAPWAGTPSQKEIAAHGLLSADLVSPATSPSRVSGKNAELESKARRYLHANCSHCHREHAGGSVLMFLNLELPLDKCGVVDAKPAQGDFELADARIVAPGDPYRSVLYYRMAKIGKGHMPYLGSSRLDPEGVALIREWIASLGERPSERPDAESHRRDLGTARKGGSDAEASLVRLASAPGSALMLADSLGEFEQEVKRRAIEKGLSSEHHLVRDLFERFLPAEQRVKSLGVDFPDEAVLGLRGDASRGRKWFFQEGGAQCSVCHQVAGEGKAFGPELTHIGGKYTHAQLLEHLRYPSRLIDPAFAGFVVESKKDDVLSGLLVSRGEAGVQLRLQSGEIKSIARADVVKIEAQALSLMPEGLLQGMTAQQAADLIEFLGDLK
ncbi:MAG: c-type cytochrome [Verrucomicrobia bacterium]|nr:c-type cytochrome [Verrucomicrobiota bacterium]